MTYKEIEDRLEVLQQTYFDLKNEFSNICALNEELQTDLLKNEEEIEKYKKVIAILKDKTQIQFLGYSRYKHQARPYEIILNGCNIRLTKKEYDLISEVLGNA